MGRLIDRIAGEQGHQIVARIDGPNDPAPMDEMEVAIDFSQPQAAFDNISRCLKAGVPVLSGTTGWLQRYDEACRICNAHEGAFLYASNFSLGVNLFFELNEYLAALMENAPGYAAEIKEIHHTRKLDAPSGTAISLAEGIIDNSSFSAWKSEGTPGNALPISSERVGDTPGTHKVSYQSVVDRIEIIHTAHNREGFARGALFAAEWIRQKKGVFTMKDVLNLR